MNLLNKFYADFQVKAEVKAYLILYLQQEAIKRAFSGVDTSGIKDAKDILDKAFRDLDLQFEVKKKKMPQSRK